MRYSGWNAVLLVANASPRRLPPRGPHRDGGKDAAARIDADGPCILVVDDNDDVRDLYAEALAGAGYEVMQASNGQEALERIAESKPALVIMDLSMPVLDGWQATKRIKADPATADILILAVTAHATRYGLQDVRDFGADDVLSKPCLPGELLRRVHELLHVDDAD